MAQNKNPWCNIVLVVQINFNNDIPLLWHYLQKIGHDKHQIFIIR